MTKANKMNTSIKKYLLLTLLLVVLHSSAQQNRMDIHQINVGNGDGALIMLYNNDKVVYTIVIDGGLATSTNVFVNYLKVNIPDISSTIAKKKIDWVILSHNHQDHFNGLVQVFEDPDFIIKEITDQDGYTIGEDNYALPLKPCLADNSVPFITLSKSKKNPQQALIDYVKAVKTADDRKFAFDGVHIIRGIVFDTTAKEFKDFTLPKVGAITPEIHCIATNGYTRGKAGRDLGNFNPNNFSYGWVIEFGAFRFYTGGDLGGYTVGYTDQETPMADYLKDTYKNAYPLTGSSTATSFPGHVCVMKTDHHGSTQSSNPAFLSTVAYSVIMTSAGKHARWKIPTVDFINRVAANPSFGAKQGIYFTQLYNYSNNKALATANSKFGGAAKYDYISPGSTAATQYSYVITVEPAATYVPPPPAAPRVIDITTESYFTVSKVQTSTGTKTLQYAYLCHKPS
ncbi:MAG: MBL fold metallo-hydrolase [Bacteroidota bacterium]